MKNGIYNYRIKTIAIPDVDDNGDKTGEFITLEVVGMQVLNTFIQNFEGGSFSEEKLYFVCFQKKEGLPKKLYVINAESNGEIEILRYEREIDKSGNSSKAKRRKKREDFGNDNNS